MLNGYDKKQLDLNAKKETDISKASSEKLLQKLMTTTRLHESTFFIRKILARNNTNQRLSMEHLQQEFGFNGSVEDHLRIRPATFIAPGLPIETYQLAWTASSGVIIITPPGEAVPMVGYKRPAASDCLSGQRMNTLGFPHKGEDYMRVHGGKPSYCVEDFFYRLSIIYFRSKGLIEDLSRKEYFKHLFINLQNDLAMHQFLSQELRLSLDEIENNMPLTNDSSDDYKVYLKLCDIIKNNFIRVPNYVAEHYYLTFKSLIIEAVAVKQSVLVVLNNREIKSYNQRLSNLKINVYMPELALLPEKILSKIATPGNRYSRQIKFPSNETLLQGLRTYDQSVDNKYPVMSIDADETTIIKRHLLKRHGNFPAVYVNMSSPSGLADAILIHIFFKKQFNQELVFVAYDESNFRISVFSIQDFKRYNYIAWDNCERQNNFLNPLQQALLPPPSLGVVPSNKPSQISHPQSLTATGSATSLWIAPSPSSPQLIPLSTNNFKTTSQWIENCEIMLNKINCLSMQLEQIYFKLNKKNPHFINANFNCTYKMVIKVYRTSSCWFYRGILLGMKCINGIFVFKYFVPGNDAESALKKLWDSFNDSNYNHDNQPLTNESFTLELQVYDVTISKRDVNETLYFAQNKSHFITYTHELNSDSHKSSQIEDLRKNGATILHMDHCKKNSSSSRKRTTQLISPLQPILSPPPTTRVLSHGLGMFTQNPTRNLSSSSSSGSSSSSSASPVGPKRHKRQ